MAETKRKGGLRKLYTSELVLYIIYGVLWLTGFVFAILGVFAYNYGKLSTNPLYALQKSFAAFFNMTGVMDFRVWGSILMLIMMVFFLVTIFFYSSHAEKSAAEERRRQERMRILMAGDEEEKNN